MIRRIWQLLAVACVIGAVVCLVIQAFNQQQPLHAELGKAAVVFGGAAVLLFFVPLEES